MTMYNDSAASDTSATPRGTARGQGMSAQCNVVMMTDGARPKRRITALVGVLLLAMTAAHTVAAELEERAAKAFAAYADEARRAFVARASLTPKRPDGIRAGPGKGDGITDVPGGLVHHWVGAAFLPQLSLSRVMASTRDYDKYPSVYTSTIVGAKTIETRDDTARVWMRIKGGGGGLSAVLEFTSSIQYVTASPGRIYSLASIDEVREVKDAGSANERLLPPGKDSGYLWRGSTFTNFTQIDGGVIVEMETLGLSRRFPAMLGWIIEPIARRLGRQSVERSLREFSASLAPLVGK